MPASGAAGADHPALLPLFCVNASSASGQGFHRELSVPPAWCYRESARLAATTINSTGSTGLDR